MESMKILVKLDDPMALVLKMLKTLRFDCCPWRGFLYFFHPFNNRDISEP